MRRFINSFPLLMLCLLAFACSKEEPVLADIPTQDVAAEAASATAKPEEPTPVTSVPEVPAAKAAAPKVAQAPARADQGNTQKLSSQEIINRFKQWDQNLRFLKTSFTQTMAYDGVPVNHSQGVLFYDKAHHLLRLDTLNESGQLEQSAITDKQTIILLDDAGRKIANLSWDEWQQGQPNQALFDFGNYTALLARHTVKFTAPNLLELTPKEGESYTLWVTLSEEDYFPVSLKIVSDLLVTQADLTNTQKNQPLELSVFGGLFQ